MYQLALTRDFVAQHYLIGGDWGAENLKHSHAYKVEVLLGQSGKSQFGDGQSGDENNGGETLAPFVDDEDEADDAGR